MRRRDIEKVIFPRSDVPLNRDSSGRFLPWLVAVMVYLATIALVSAMAMHKLSRQWDSGLSGQMTVQVPPPISPPAAGQARRDPAEEVLAILRDTPGIAGAEILAEAEIQALLEPWLGSASAFKELPLPRLIAVTMADRRAVEMDALRARLDGVAPGIVVDDHQRWLGNLLDLARTIELVAILVVGLVSFSAVIMVVFVTRMGLAVHRHVIDLLHLVGAQDAYVARQFQAHAFKFGLLGGLIGLAIAVPTIFLVAFLLNRIEGTIMPAMSLSSVEWTVLALVPLIAAAITTTTARMTVLRNLARMP